MLRALTGFILILLLIGCSSVKPEDYTTLDSLYQQILIEIEDEDYTDAEVLIAALKSEYPFSPQAVEVELFRADIEFEKEEFELSAASYRRFFEMHPAHEKLPYALYKRALSYRAMMDSEDRDQLPTRQMVETAKMLLAAYPQSEYADEAEKMVSEGRKSLALHELYVAEYYFNRDEYGASAGRARIVIEQYGDTGLAERARGILEKANAAEAQEDR
ncbi:MAG: hypothetical protein C0608_03915 [Deltaproteobacteria bacterium]|nr:MAG: hypothetical protein C0608_03915 [Deltaproteobacteria bacterium]